MLIVMFLVTTVVFCVARIIPGDPAAVMLGPSATAADVAALRTRMGLDEALPLQYWRFLRDVVRLDLGQSIFLGQSVVSALLDRAPVTLQLTGLAALLATGIGIPVGVVAAMYRGGVVDQAATVLCTTMASLPSFWIGLTLIEYLAVRTRLFPVAGYPPPGADLIQQLRSLVLPATAVGLPNLALIARLTRTSMLDVLQEDYVRTAKAKGLTPLLVIMRHAFRNAQGPVLTAVGLTVASLIGGAIVTETVFGLPGIGNLVVSAVLRRDYPVIQGALLVVTGAYVLINLGIDLLYLAIDPRLRA